MTGPGNPPGGGAGEPGDPYLVQHLHEALARDPRTNELEVNVVVVGNKIFLTGTVASPERREAITIVASEASAGREIHNQTSVVELRPAEEAEELT